MAWNASLSLGFRREAARTLVRDRHDGPLRLLKALYPEGDAVCHAVVVHPPGGVVGGDRLEIAIRLDRDAHALVTTPGATRFYRSAGAPASQSVRADVAAGGRLEWLPLETIAHSGCLAASGVSLALASGAEAIGWDVLALGLPASAEPFVAGRYAQSIAVGDAWLDRGRIDGDDRRLRESPLGFDGRSVLATMWFAAGDALGSARRARLVDAARATIAGDALASHAGVTSPAADVVVVRALADRVEPAMALWQHVRAAWRREAWNLQAPAPRVWRT